MVSPGVDSPGVPASPAGTPGTTMLAPVTVSGVAATVLVVTTANVFGGLPAGPAAHDVRLAVTGSSIVGFQEMAGRRAARMVPAGYACWQAARGPGRGVPVCWHRGRLALVAAHTTILHRSTLFRSATRAATVIVLRDRATGRPWPVVNVHMIPAIERRGRLVSTPRRRLAVRALTRIMGLVDGLESRYGRVLVTGDFNIDAVSDRRVRDPRLLFTRMNTRPRDLDASWNRLPLTAATLGRRRVDYVWWTHGRVRPIVARTLTGTRSDHNFLRVRLRG